MTQITHEEARRLIHYSVDQTLDQMNLFLLSAHLEECQGCSAYASELKELEDILQGTMQRKWSLSPAPLPIHVITTHARSKPFDFMNHALATRTAAIALTILVILFGTWQFSRTDYVTPSKMLTFALPVPTPSTYLTSTSNLFQSCDHILHIVQKHDTLESIALQYEVSKDDIMQFNNMETETLYPSTQIRIPLCHSTPTGTINAPTTTTTITPQLEPLISTPG